MAGLVSFKARKAPITRLSSRWPIEGSGVGVGEEVRESREVMGSEGAVVADIGRACARGLVGGPCSGRTLLGFTGGRLVKVNLILKISPGSFPASSILSPQLFPLSQLRWSHFPVSVNLMTVGLQYLSLQVPFGLLPWAHLFSGYLELSLSPWFALS